MTSLLVQMELDAAKYLREEISKLREQLAETYSMSATEAVASIPALGEYVACLEQRTEAAEAKFKAASEQEPIGFIRSDYGLQFAEYQECMAYPDRGGDKYIPVYATPIPPAVNIYEQKYVDCLIAEQQKRIAEMERKLAEQQAIFHVNMLRAWPEKSHDEIANAINSKAGPIELNTLLAQAREESRKETVPDGWQVVPVNPTSEMTLAGERERLSHVGNINPRTTWLAMLASAPTPEVKP